MRFGDLIRELGQDHSGKINYAELSRRAGGKPSPPRFHHYGQEPDPDDTDNPRVRQTEWGTIATMDSATDAASVIGVCRALKAPTRTAWLAVGESIGLPGMFNAGTVDEAVAKLAPGWHTLDLPRAALLRQLTETLVRDQRAEPRPVISDTMAAELEARDALIAELEAELAELRAMIGKGHVKPT